MERYIGMDAHAASCTLAVISETGRKLKDFPVETNGQVVRGGYPGAFGEAKAIREALHAAVGRGDASGVSEKPKCSSSGGASTTDGPATQRAWLSTAST